MSEDTREAKEIHKIRGKDREGLARNGAKKFYESLTELLSSNERIVVSLPGGRSVKSFYKKIPEMTDRLSGEDWRRVHFFWTDERLVPPSSPESNYRLAEELFIEELMGHGLVQPDQIHRFPGETESSEEKLNEYCDELDRISNGVIHLPILGVGGDGHVGSIFPDSFQLDEHKSEFLLVKDSPKPPDRRITISPWLIKESTYPFLFFVGEEKRDAYECFRKGTKTYIECPCRLALYGSSGICYVITDLE